MKQTESFGYTEGNGYQAVELPYDGREISMVVLLPAAGNFDKFDDSVDYQQVEGIINSLEHRKVTLSMPEFEYESSFSLKTVLTMMGIPVAFTRNADFSGMTGGRDLFIADVVHKAFVNVDEEGTVAAAATAAYTVEDAEEGGPPVFRADHPFLFLIRHNPSGTILFIGRVVNPKE